MIAPAPPPGRHRRPRRRAVLAAAVVALAAGTAVALALSGGAGVERHPRVAVGGLRPGRLSDPVLLAWDSKADRSSAQRAAVAAAFDGTGDLRRAAATLTGFTSPTERPAAAAGGRGVTRATVSLDRFGEVVTPTSRIGVLVACERGRFRMTLGTVTQGRSQIIVAPLAVASGPCGHGVEQIRYRPIRGLLPTTATLQVPAGSEGVLDVSITG